MKNFTNNFKQFTSRLSARWLIMALMLLVGTSSAWAQTWCLAGSFNGWSDATLSNGKLTVTISSIGEYQFKIKQKDTWDGAYSNDAAQMKRDDCSNWLLYTNKGDSKFYADVVGDYTFTFNSASKTLSITYPPQCTTCCTNYYVAGDEGLCGENWNVNADKMTCSDNVWTKTFTNVNNGTYYFQITNGTWDVKKGEYDNSKGNITLSNVDDGYGAKKIKLTTTSKGNITISFNGENAWVNFDKSCNTPTDQNFTYTAPADLVYNGQAKSATVSWNGTQGGDITIYYKNDDVYSEEAPSAVGEYEVYVTTTENSNFCALTKKTKVGSFIIKCTEDIAKDKFSYTLPTDAKYTGDPHAVSVEWKSGTTQTNGAITVYYKQGSGEYTTQAPTLAGTYTVAAKVTTAGNYCVSKNYIELGQFEISLAKQEDFSISTDISVCGATTTLSATGGSGEGDITYTIGSTNTANARIEGGTLMATTSGSVEVTATKEGEEGKYLPTSSTVTIEFTMPEAPFAGNPQSTTICAGSTFRYVADYFWYTSESGNQTVTGSAPLYATTEYYISQEIKGCESARTQYTVNVDQPLVAPTLTLTNPTRCKDKVTPGSIVIENYSNYDNSISFKLYKENSPIEIPYENGYAISEEGSYKVEMVTTNSNVCGQTVYSEDEEVVITNNTPAATITIDAVTPICAGGSSTLKCNVDITQGTNPTYTWTLPSGETSNENPLNTGVLNTAGNYEYSVVVTLENNGCSKPLDPVTQTVTVHDAPQKPNFGENNSETVCQGTTVTLPTELNSVQLNWYTDLNKTSSITSFPANDEKTVYAAAYNGTCESAELAAYTYNIYPVPTISVSPSKIDATCYQMVTLTANTGNTVEGALVEWYEGETLKGTGNTYTFTKETASPATTITAKVRNYTTCDYVTADATVSFTAHEVCSTNSYVQGKIAYMTIGDNTFGKGVSGAWYAAYFYKGNTNKWVKMTDEDNDGTWACEIPEGYTHVIFCYMKPDQTAMNWGNKNNQTAGDNKVSIPTTAQKCIVTGNGNHKWEDLESGKSFKTIALNGNGLWNVGGASVYAHPWSMSNPNTDGWSRMIPGINAGEYLVDVYTNYTDIMFERRDPSGNKYDGGADKHKTADLKLDIYGNEFKITEYGHNDGASKANGEWQWKWYANSYTLGLSTKASVTDGSTTINATGAFYKTDCAPGLEFGFKYIKSENEPTESDWASANAKYVDNRPIAVGEEFAMNIDAAGGGIYWVRSYGRYNNGTYTYGNVVRVIVQGCTAGYEFEVANTSAVVQACGESRLLPAIEFLSNTEVAGETFTYQWKNEDDSDATNLSATNIATPTFFGKSSQNYKVIVAKMVGGQLKCSKTATYQVAYEDNSPKATIEAREEVAINETLVLQGSINYSESFTWLVKEGNIDVTAQKLSDVSVLNPTFNTQETGTYTVTLTAEANENCEAHQTSITIEVLPPTENCSSSELEIGFSGSHDCFNTSGGVNLLIKTDNSCIEVAKISSGNTYTLTKEYLQENNLNYPIKIFFGALNGNHCNTSNELKGYTDFQEIKESDLGNKVIYSFPTGVEYQQTSDVCGYGRKYTNIQKSSTASTKASAPSVLYPAAVVNGQSTEVELKAYLETTGCSTISDYGFEYIKQDEQPTSDTEATKVSLKATTISIGKIFRTQVTGLTEGVYWFRAYANNEAGKSGSTSWISFTIITDGPYPTLNCNNNALQILDNGKVKVTVTNIGNEPVLKGSYGLTIIDQGAVLAYSPQQVPAIDEDNGTVEFTTVLPINKNNYNVTATLTYKGRTQSCNTKICVPQVGGTPDTIRYTIDAAAVTDKCMLVFPTVYEAIDHLKSSKNGDDRFVDKVGDGYMLRQPVVMEVVYSTTPYCGNVRLTTTGGYEGGEGHLVINITNINNDGNSGNGKYKINESGNIVDGYNPLIIRAANPNAMPALQHVALRKSRSVTLRNLNIISSDEDKDNAIDIDNNNNSWVGNGIGAFKNARITISNCKIKSKGFTCVHVSAVDKVYFENNEITADLENKDVQDENTRCWGSSVKFIRSTNIKFIRNNFMGTHATSVWLQGVEKVLFMNNVFWNNNKIEEDIFAMFRIVQQSDPEKPKNIGIYYNTLFLADNSDGRSKHPKFNFLTLNSNDASSKDDPIAHDGTFETSTIEFKYNNCYSYDLETPGKPSNSFKGREAWSGLCYNNFWSAKSGADFSFNGCSTIYNVNVKDIVCTTTATDPNSLVISQPGLNLGNKPTVDAETGNVGTSGIALNSDAELYYDRTRDEARVGVAEGDWTLGAYQQTANVLTEAIIWQGSVSNEWDDRNNWIDARTKNTLTCVNTLSQNLQVIIPAPHSENYPAPDERGIVNYPILPKFDERDSRFGGELVNAGQGIITPTFQFAKTINMEYGASLRGVEHLGAGNDSHYDETTTGFTAQRDQWILVGTVVKPWTDKTKQSTRNIKSGDYFITGQTPHVYMNYAYMDGNTAKWSEPFTSLEESLEVTDVMAINIPNQYGAGKLTSQAYYTYVKKDPTKINDHLEAKDYSFNGRFVNETALPNYTGLTSGVPTLLNNSYPANIDPKVIEAKNLGTVLMYDYKAGSFCIDPQVDREAVIKPQHGFIFTPAGDALTITSDMVVNGETTSRSAGVEMPILSLDLYNANSINGERSRVVVKLDELKDEGPAPLDVTKIFTDNSTTPELYIVMYDNQYQRIHISNTETIIPLGIRLKKSMNVSFQKFSAEGFDKVTLVDKVLKTEYDLLNTKEVITEELSAGDIEGRFFLNLKETEEDDNIEGDDNVSTEIEEDSAEKCINILVEADNTVKVITNGVELENIYVSDMAGRTVGYKASGYSAVVELPVVQGVYMINVIGDTASRTEKVILK